MLTKLRNYLEKIYGRNLRITTMIYLKGDLIDGINIRIKRGNWHAVIYNNLFLSDEFNHLHIALPINICYELFQHGIIVKNMWIHDREVKQY